MYIYIYITIYTIFVRQAKVRAPSFWFVRMIPMKGQVSRRAYIVYIVLWRRTPDTHL